MKLKNNVCMVRIMLNNVHFEVHFLNGVNLVQPFNIKRFPASRLGRLKSFLILWNWLLEFKNCYIFAKSNRRREINWSLSQGFKTRAWNLFEEIERPTSVNKLYFHDYFELSAQPFSSSSVSLSSNYNIHF